MQYTTDQLIALLEEARGYVHDSAMGAIWTKQRHAKMQDFLDRTFCFDVTDSKGVTKTSAKGKDVVLMVKTVRKVSSKPVADTVANGLTPEQVAHNLTVDGYTGGFLSIEDEVKNLREKDKLPYGRDFLRKVVKILREHPVQKITPPTGQVFDLSQKPATALLTVDRVFGPNPKEKSTDLLSTGYRSQGGSVDHEVKHLKDIGVTGSRDFLREVVKIIRSHQGITK